MAERRDVHHLLFPRAEWSLRPDAKRLRETQGMMVRLDRSVHDEIHRECPPVPLLGFYALQRTIREFYPQRDTLATIDSFVEAVDIAAKHPKAHRIERELAQLTIDAVLLERPFVADYMASQQKTIIDLGVS